MGWRGGREERAGWIKASPAIELEIRTVWQEDEMPVEVTSGPGYVPFTLGPEAQDWVDSMSEVVDGGKAVFGRPKPATPRQHRQLASQPAPPIPPPTPAVSVPHDITRRVAAMPAIDSPAASRPPPLRATPPAQPPAAMPEIGAPSVARPTPAQARQTPAAMPEIADRRPRTLPRRVVMPEIGDEPSDRPLLPEIGSSGG